MSRSVSWPFIGNTQLGKVLSDSWQAGTLPAVMVWRGPESVGKASAAMWLVQTTLCQQPNRPCQRCAACRQVLGGTHPAVVWLSGSAIASIAIDDVRQATRQFHWAALDNEQRWFVMTDAEYLTEGATNAILKFLEEPPAKLHILLTTSQPDRLLATMTSRAAVYYWHTISDEELEALRPAELAASAWRQIVARASGRPGLAKTLLQQSQYADHEDEYRDALLQALATGRPVQLGKQLTPAAITDILSIWELVSRELLLTKLGASSRRLWPRHQAFTAAADTLSLMEITQLIQRYLNRYSLLEHNVQPRLIVEDLQLA